jgi:hypothetical protein
MRDSLPKPSVHILFRQKLEKLEAEAKGNGLAGPEIFKLIEKIRGLAVETERNHKMRVEQLDEVIRESDNAAKGRETGRVKEREGKREKEVVVGNRSLFNKKNK